MRPAYTPIELRHIDRRRSPRRRTLLAGRLAVDVDFVTVACGIRNLSDDGALIELESTMLLKPPFRLLTIRDGTIYDAELCWSWGKRAGLRFTARYDAAAPVADDLLRLRQIGRALHG